MAIKKISIKSLLNKILNSINSIHPYILNSKTTFASAAPIIFKEYDSGLVTIAATNAATVTASCTPPTNYTGYIIRCRVQNGSGGSGESGQVPYNFYFSNSTTLAASVRNNFSTASKVHVLFTVMWVNKNLVGTI